MAPGGIAVGTQRQQVAMLRQAWDDRYEIGFAGGCWLAIWLYAGNDAEPLSAPTPDLLAVAIAADWAGRSTS